MDTMKTNMEWRKLGEDERLIAGDEFRLKWPKDVPWAPISEPDCGTKVSRWPHHEFRRRVQPAVAPPTSEQAGPKSNFDPWIPAIIKKLFPDNPHDFDYDLDSILTAIQRLQEVRGMWERMEKPGIDRIPTMQEVPERKNEPAPEARQERLTSAVHSADLAEVLGVPTIGERRRAEEVAEQAVEAWLEGVIDDDSRPADIYITSLCEAITSALLEWGRGGVR